MNIGRLDVPVHDVLAMSIVQCFGGARHQFQDAAWRQEIARPGRSG
jgi:hypothetical protein